MENSEASKESGAAFTTSPWIRSWRWDFAWILCPLLLPAFWVLAAKPGHAEVNSWQWAVLVLAVDVSHVWSTLVVTYFKPGELRRLRSVYIYTPIACFLVAFFLHYGLGSAAFWRCAAYFAVFHFVRQQYGFLRVYSRAGDESVWAARISTVALYASVGVPLALWHLELPKPFYWFKPGDFVDLPQALKQLGIASGTTLGLLSVVKQGLKVGLVLSLLVFIFKEFRGRSRANWGRLILVLSTATSWWVGIQVAQGDLAFTAVNVVAHGIPYMALVYWNREKTAPFRVASTGGFGVWFAVLVGVLGIAYLEEGLWAGWIWREHFEIFWPFFSLNPLESDFWVSVATALLCVPQLTHYVLDGVIWKGKAFWENRLRMPIPVAKELASESGHCTEAFRQREADGLSGGN